MKIKEKSVGPEIAISSVALQKMWHSVAKFLKKEKSYLRGRSQTTLTRFRLLLTTCLPVDIDEGIPLLL